MSKIWKKLLMAILIICILFNIINKLISRTNLKDQLRSVIGQESIFSFFDRHEEPGSSGSGSNGSSGSNNGSSGINGSTEFINGSNQNGQGSSSYGNGQINSSNQYNIQNGNGQNGSSTLDQIENVAGNILTNAGDKINSAAQNVYEQQNRVIDRGTATGEQYEQAYKEGIGDWPQQIWNSLTGIMDR